MNASRRTSTESNFRKLVRDLLRKTSAKTILGLLNATYIGFRDVLELGIEGPGPLKLLQAGGLPAVIRHLSGTATSADPDVSPSAISDAAANVLYFFLRKSPLTMAEVQAATGIVLPLIDALRDAPIIKSRAMAAAALRILARSQPAQLGAMADARLIPLLILARSQPAQLGAMADARLIPLLIALYTDIGDLSERLNAAMLDPTTDLGSVLMCSESAAARDLQQAICGAETNQSYAALVLLQGSLERSREGLVPALVKAGVVEALVATLKHESPFCVAAAAGALFLVMQHQGGRQVVLDTSGAIPSLVDPLGRQFPPADPQQEVGLFCRAANEFKVEDLSLNVHSNNPIIVVAACLGVAGPFTKPMMDSLVEAGGVPSIVRLVRDSTCPEIVGHLSHLIFRLLLDGENQGFRPEGREVARKLHEAGLSQAVVLALGNHAKNTRGQLLNMLNTFLAALTRGSTLADFAADTTITELVAGGVVEHAVAHEVEHTDVAEWGQRHMGVNTLFLFGDHPRGLERLVVPGTVDRLMIAIGKWLLEAHEPLVDRTLDLLAILVNCPQTIPAAVKGHGIPGLVQILRKRLPTPDGAVPELGADRNGISQACVVEILKHDARHGTQFWRSVVDAGIVPVVVRLLSLRQDHTVVSLLAISHRLLDVVPHGEGGEWAVALPRAISRLISVKPQLVPNQAAGWLLMMGQTHPELLADNYKWGMGDSLVELSRDSDPITAATASHLLSLVHRVSQSAMRATAAEPTDMPPKGFHCAWCGTTKEMMGTGKLKECSVCRSVQYCGKTCQKVHWPMHKVTCKCQQGAQG